MIDLHAHVLAGIDDGPRTLEESLAMVRLAMADGIAAVAATPHVSSDHPRPEAQETRLTLSETLRREGIAVEIVAGGEIALSAAAAARLADGTLPTINGTRYALVELPFELAPPNFEHYLFEIQLAGFTPILAHVERYRWVQPTPSRLDALGERGVVLQITAASFRGDFGTRARRTAEYVLGRSLPAIVASDAHDARSRRPELAFARGLIEAYAGSPRRADLLEHGPAAVLAGEPFPRPTAQEELTRARAGAARRAPSLADRLRTLSKLWRRTVRSG